MKKYLTITLGLGTIAGGQAQDPTAQEIINYLEARRLQDE
jgi:hypothetical protein